MNYVLGFMFDVSCEQVLLIQKNRPAWQKGLYNGIGGKIENELPIEAMVREFKEETGILTVEKDWTFFTRIENSDFNINIFFIKSDDIFTAKSVESEQVKIFDVENLPKNVIYNLNWIIPLILDGALIVPGVLKHR